METDTNIDTANTSEQPSTEPTEPQSGLATPQTEDVTTSDNNGQQYTKEAFDRLNAAYSLTEPAKLQSGPATPQSEDVTSSDDGGQSDYSITFPESFAEHPEVQAFNTILAPIAKQSGMDGTAFGQLFADAYSAIEEARQRSEWQNRFRQDSDLKKDWGADYEANMATARSHIAFLKDKAGLTDADLAVFASPKGMRALYAMATVHAAPPAAGLEFSSHNEKAWAAAVMQPDHPDHDAFTNPMNSRYKEINQRWLRANGH